jgi:hypothetical protein
MRDHSFLPNSFYVKGIALSWLIMPFSMAISLAIFTLLVLAFCMFRQESLSSYKLRSVDNSILLAPVSGKVEERITERGVTSIKIKLSCLWKFGINMPASGEVVTYLQSSEDIKFAGLLPMTISKKQLEINTDQFGKIKVIDIDKR